MGHGNDIIRILLEHSWERGREILGGKISTKLESLHNVRIETWKTYTPVVKDLFVMVPFKNNLILNMWLEPVPSTLEVLCRVSFCSLFELTSFGIGMWGNHTKTNLFLFSKGTWWKLGKHRMNFTQLPAGKWQGPSHLWWNHHNAFGSDSGKVEVCFWWWGQLMVNCWFGLVVWDSSSRPK